MALSLFHEGRLYQVLRGLQVCIMARANDQSFFFLMYCMVPSNKPQTTILGALCSTNMGALYHIVWYAMYETANEPQFRARSFLIALYCMVRWVRSLLSALYRMVRYETANGGRAKRICARKPRGSTYPESC